MKNNKSLTKANGLKSTFILGDQHIYMTSFGKGSTAKPEKDIKNAVVKNIRNTFSVNTVNNTKYCIKGKVGESYAYIPQFENSLNAKSTIEKMFFGKTFVDNIHIQVAYNIMDIQKILTTYLNIVVYTINNMDRDSSNRDFLGMFSTQNSFELTKIVSKAYKLNLLSNSPNKKYRFSINEKVWNKYKDSELNDLNNEATKYLKNKNKSQNVQLSYSDISSYLEHKNINNMKIVKKISTTYDNFNEFCKVAQSVSYYFGDVFADDEGKFSEKKTFEGLRLLGEFRQNSFHGFKIKNNLLFNLENADKGIKNELNNCIYKKIKNINKNFTANNKVNISILKNIYTEKPIENLVCEYYDFLIRKDFKNIGFSIKTIREQILTFDDAKDLCDKKYDAVRPKFYSLFDFVLYNYYLENLENEENSQNIVSELRLAISEDDKKIIYFKEAKKVWESISNIILEQIKPYMNSAEIKKLNKEDKVKVEDLDKYVQSPTDLSYFSKAVYYLTLFLDGKEINMLLSSLINKFENIASFVDMLNFLNIELSFLKDFEFFKNSKKVAKDLRFIQSFARMNKGKKVKKNSNVSVKKIQYLDSAAVFGETDAKRIEQLYHINTRDKDEKKDDKALRNFMINNVINNNRFVYVIRFLSPQDARKIMECEPLVKFILKDLPKTQIERYCKTVNIAFSENDIDNSINLLTQELLNVKFDNFLDVKQKVKTNSYDEKKKEQYKAIISLYLTVLYLIVKSLVKINTTYSIAFSVLERDLTIYNLKENTKDYYLSKNNRNKNFTYHAHYITEYFDRNNLLNKRVKMSIYNNSKYYKGETFKVYRNCVDHLQAIAELPKYAHNIKVVKSMFDVYHCLLLDAILKQSHNGFTEKEIENIRNQNNKYNTVWKDFLYGINRPFAYNAARYINLSNREKFLEGYGK